MSARDEALVTVERILSDRAAAEDVVHETLLAVCSRHDRYGLRDLRPYFFAAVYNNARREWRHQRRFCELDPDDPAQPTTHCVSAQESPGNAEIELEKAAHLALCALPANERRLFGWRVWDNLSHEDIARRLGIATPTARQRYHRIVSSVREKISERCR